MASTLPPPNAGGTPTARIGIDLTELQRAPGVARQMATATAREIANAAKEIQRGYNEIGKQQTAELRAALTQRKVAVKAAAKEEADAAKLAAREAAAAEKQRLSEMKAALQQRKVAVKAALREEVEAERQAAAQRRAVLRGGATFAGAALGGPLGGAAGALAGGSAAIPFVAGLAVNETIRLSKESTQAASDLSEAINKANVAFDSSASTIINWSKTSANALGQSRHDALEAASSFGLLFREMGLGTQRSAEMSQRMVELATDMASIHNIRPEDALEKLRAGLIGETRPLRDVGVLLSDQVVRQKAVSMGLAETTAAVTDQERVLARYQLILEQTSLTQGDFQRTITGLANQQRIFNAEWKDFLANTGKIQQGPGGLGLAGVNSVLNTLNNGMEWFNDQTALALQQWVLLRNVMNGMSLRTAYRAPQQESFDRAMIAAGRTNPSRGGAGGWSDEQIQLEIDHNKRLADIDRRANREIVESAAQYARQRADVIASYDKQIARDAEDYARQRARAETKYQQSIVDILRDDAEKRAELTRDYDESVADARAKSTERLAKIDADYNRERERAERSHRETLLDAAGRLDAAAVVAEQRQYAEAKRNRDEDYRDRVTEERDNLAERLADEQKTYDKQMAAARKASDDRLTELTNSYNEQRRIEDEDRAIRLARQAQDHTDQLAEMDRQQAERIQQLRANAAEERQQTDKQFEEALAATGKKTDAFIAQQDRLTDAAIKSLDRWWAHVNATIGPSTAPSSGTSGGTMLPYPPRLNSGTNYNATPTTGAPYIPRLTQGYADGGPVRTTGMALVHRGEYMLSPSATAAVRNTIGNFDQASLVAALRGMGGRRGNTWTGNLIVNALPGQNPEQIADMAVEKLITFFQAASQ